MTTTASGMRVSVLTGPGPDGQHEGTVTVCKSGDHARPVLVVIGIGREPSLMLQMTEGEILALREFMFQTLVNAAAPDYADKPTRNNTD